MNPLPTPDLIEDLKQRVYIIHSSDEFVWNKEDRKLMVNHARLFDLIRQHPDHGHKFNSYFIFFNDWFNGRYDNRIVEENTTWANNLLKRIEPYDCKPEYLAFGLMHTDKDNWLLLVYKAENGTGSKFDVYHIDTDYNIVETNIRMIFG